MYISGYILVVYYANPVLSGINREDFGKITHLTDKFGNRVRHCHMIENICSGS